MCFSSSIPREDIFCLSYPVKCQKVTSNNVYTPVIVPLKFVKQLVEWWAVPKIKIWLCIRNLSLYMVRARGPNILAIYAKQKKYSCYTRWAFTLQGIILSPSAVLRWLTWQQDSTASWKCLQHSSKDPVKNLILCMIERGQKIISQSQYCYRFTGLCWSRVVVQLLVAVACFK